MKLQSDNKNVVKLLIFYLVSFFLIGFFYNLVNVFLQKQQLTSKAYRSSSSNVDLLTFYCIYTWY